MGHTWRFQRAGGFDQVVVDTADDLRRLATLDQKLWVALACPVKGNQLDEVTLALVDSDNDGRIRAPELLAAIAWCDGVFVDLSVVLGGRDGMALSSVRDPVILASAKRVLTAMGRPEASTLTVEDTSGARALLDALPFNGDGVVPPASAQGATRAALEDILATVGGAADRNGDQGVDVGAVTGFFDALTAYDAWWSQAEVDEDTVVPLGTDTAPAIAAFVAVKDKIEDFFTRCALAAFDPRAVDYLAGDASRWGEVGARTLSPSDDEIAAFPLASIAPGRALPLHDGLNPAWAERIGAFTTMAVEPLLGARDQVDEREWADLKGRFAAYEAWLASKQGEVVEALGIDRVRALLTGPARSELLGLIARDEARRPEADALQAVDRATRYHRDLVPLVSNFVSFRDFYDPDRRAMFQAGVLYLDGRSCDLVMRVEDVGVHSVVADQSYAFIAYCACVRKATSEKMSIAAAFTDGDSDFLAVGRNGLFYDREGRDWDATIVKVVEQPISIRQAFWAPYKRLVRFISEQAEKFASEQDQAAQADLTAKASGTPDAASAFDIGKFAGIFAAVGLALGFLVSAITVVVSGLLSLRPWQMPIALLAVVLLISGPSMLLAAFKLRRRNLAPLLDANGWAINARARINIPFGESLTQVAALPPGSKRDLSDPFRERRSRWPWVVAGLVLLLVAAIAWDSGLVEWGLDQLMPPPP